ncbi:MAG: SH3 domain-containing protein [Chloroflexota bacterium]|nr:SH3 domain-containing protein [Chloroflexota bacterium]
MNELTGKGMFTWVIPDCEGGDIDAIIARAKEAQLTFLMPKIANGTVKYSHNLTYLAEFVEKCHAAGIKVIAWHYVYGTYPESEARRSIEELSKYPYDGFVINAEKEYKGRPAQAKIYCKMLRAAFPDLFIGLSSYRYPDYHPELPWNEFLTYCDVNMPQVYWEQADGTAASQLDRCIALFTDPKFIQRPIMPTGAAYTNAGWVAKPDDIIDFIKRADELELSAISFWEWRYPRSRFPELWTAIVNTPFGEYEEPEMPDMQPTGIYNIKLSGSFYLRAEPTDNSAVVGYGYPGDVFIGLEKTADNWYRLALGGVETAWISGRTKYTTITEILAPVPVDPPEPTPEPLTDRERIENLEIAVFGEVQQ